MSDQPACDFGKHIIPYCHENGKRIFAYQFEGYWKDVGTLGSYWEANMELIDLVPVFNLYDKYWNIYTKCDVLPPQYISSESVVERSLISEGTEVHGNVYASVIGSGVKIGKGAVVRNSIIMDNVIIGEGAVVEKAIIADDVVVGNNAKLGMGEYAESQLDQRVYTFDIVTVGEKSVIPENVTIGKNVAISGETAAEDYPDGQLPSGGYIIKAGEGR